MRALLIWLAAVLLAAGARGRQGPRCQVEQKVEFILLTMNKNTVRAVVDCVVSPDRIDHPSTPCDTIHYDLICCQVGIGSCDTMGRDIKRFAPTAVCSPRYTALWHFLFQSPCTLLLQVRPELFV